MTVKSPKEYIADYIENFLNDTFEKFDCVICGKKTNSRVKSHWQLPSAYACYPDCKRKFYERNERIMHERRIALDNYK